MSNNKQQTAVEWFSNQAHELFEQYSEGNFDRITLNKLMLQATANAKEMEKDRIINSHIDGQPLYSCQREKAEQYYEQTYGGGER
jgi:hypothetical protein